MTATGVAGGHGRVSNCVAMAAIRVVIAEDNLLVRSGLQALLGDLDDFEVVAACASLDELLVAVDGHCPDLVLTDIRMPPMQTEEGIEAATALRSSHPETGVLVLSQFVDVALAMRLVADGSNGRGYLLKDRIGDVDELVRAMVTVARGGSFIDPTVVDSLVSARTRGVRSPLHHLTDREREVLSEIANGCSNAAAADRLGIGERAIEKHINSIFSKLGLIESGDVHRRVAAVLLFLQEDA